MALLLVTMAAFLDGGNWAKCDLGRLKLGPLMIIIREARYGDIRWCTTCLQGWASHTTTVEWVIEGMPCGGLLGLRHGSCDQEECDAEKLRLSRNLAGWLPRIGAITIPIVVRCPCRKSTRLRRALVRHATARTLLGGSLTRETSEAKLDESVFSSL